MPPVKKRKLDQKQQRVDQMLLANKPRTEPTDTPSDIVAPKGIENSDFPVNFRTFFLNTNIKDIVVEEIKYHKPNTYKNYMNDTMIMKMAGKFYVRFYTLMSYRLSKPLNALTIADECSPSIREQIASFPYNETQTTAIKHMESIKIVDGTEPIEAVIQRFPVTLNTFKKSTHWQELVDAILEYYTKGDESKLEDYRNNTEMREQIIRNYYYNFYARCKTRKQFHIRLRPMPAHVHDKLLYTPTSSELRANENDSLNDVSSEKSNVRGSKRKSGGNECSKGKNVQAGTSAKGHGPIKEVSTSKPLRTIDANVGCSKQIIEPAGSGSKDVATENSHESLRKSLPNISTIQQSTDNEEAAESISIENSKKPAGSGSKDVTTENSHESLRKSLQNFPTIQQTTDNEEAAENNSIENSSFDEETITKQVESVRVVDATLASERLMEKFPVTLSTFKRSTYWQETIDVILNYYTKNDMSKLEELKSDTQLCAQILLNYYYNFYTRPNVREQFPIRLKSMPAHIKQKLLDIPTLKELEGETTKPHKVTPSPNLPQFNDGVDLNNAENTYLSEERICGQDERTTVNATHTNSQMELESEQITCNRQHQPVQILSVETLVPANQIDLPEKEAPLPSHISHEHSYSASEDNQTNTNETCTEPFINENVVEEPNISNSIEQYPELIEDTGTSSYIVLDKDLIAKWESEEVKNIDDCPEEWDSIIHKPLENVEPWKHLCQMKEAKNPRVDSNDLPHETFAQKEIDTQHNHKKPKPFPRSALKRSAEPEKNKAVVCDVPSKQQNQQNNQNSSIAEATTTQLTSSSKKKSQSVGTTTLTQSTVEPPPIVSNSSSSMNTTAIADNAADELGTMLASTMDLSCIQGTEMASILEQQINTDNILNTMDLSNHYDPLASLNAMNASLKYGSLPMEIGIDDFINVPNTQQQIEALPTETISTEDPLSVDQKRVLIENSLPAAAVSGNTDAVSTAVKQEKVEMLKNVRFIYDDSKDTFVCIPIRESEDIISILDESSSTDINLTAELMRMPSAFNSFR